MTDTDPPSQLSEDDSFVSVDPRTTERRSRLLLFGGLGGLAIGNVLGTPLVTWGSVAILTLAFALNTAGKLVHYWDLSIPRADRLHLAASWTLLALTVVGLLMNYTYARYGPGNGSFFWALAVAGIGFGLLHLAAQSKYLPVSEKPTEQ